MRKTHWKPHGKCEYEREEAEREKQEKRKQDKDAVAGVDWKV